MKINTQKNPMISFTVFSWKTYIKIYPTWNNGRYNDKIVVFILYLSNFIDALVVCTKTNVFITKNGIGDGKIKVIGTLTLIK